MTDAKKTLPPDVKKVILETEAKSKDIAQLVGAVTDIFGILMVGILIGVGRMDPDPWGYMIIALAGGSIIGKARGKLGGSTMAFVGVLLAKGAGGGLSL